MKKFIKGEAFHRNLLYIHSPQICPLYSLMLRIPFLLFVLFVLLITGEGANVDMGNNTRITNYHTQKSRLHLHHHLDAMWPLQSLIGILGTLLNSFLAYVFYHERQALSTSVNMMIV